MTTLQHASRARPCHGERVSGDSAIVRTLESGVLAAIVDVLGHGPEAHELALKIDAFVMRYGSADVLGLMKRLHAYLRGSRGAAVGLCAFDADSGRIDYAGVGNTVLRRFGQSETRLVSRDGVLGQNMRTPHLQSLQLEKGDLVLLYTDGVRDRFAREDYPSLVHEPPADVARKVIERFGKAHDDACCIAVRY